MFANTARQKSLSVYHLQMGGADADALEWRSLLAPRFRSRLRRMGVLFVGVAAEADIVVVTGLLTQRNLDAVMRELAAMPTPSALVAAGDAAISGGLWAEAGAPGLAPFPLSHYADIQLTVPGNPPTPQAFLAALGAARLLLQPQEPLEGWKDE